NHCGCQPWPASSSLWCSPWHHPILPCLRLSTIGTATHTRSTVSPLTARLTLAARAAMLVAHQQGGTMNSKPSQTLGRVSVNVPGKVARTSRGNVRAITTKRLSREDRKIIQEVEDFADMEHIYQTNMEPHTRDHTTVVFESYIPATWGF